MTGDRRREQERHAWLVGVLLFSLALTLRILFWQATPGAAGPFSPYYTGDTSTWLAYAQALREFRPFELGLPLRPPGVGYLLAAIWDGHAGTVPVLRLLWCMIGAVTVALIYVAVFRSFGFRVALVTGLLCACSTGLLVLSTALNSETPYLLLVAAGFSLWESLRHRPRVTVVTAWAALHAVACLFRVEHVLLFALLSLYLGTAWARHREAGPDWIATLKWTGLSLCAFGLVLMPWHVHAWARIRDFNTEPLPMSAGAEQVHRQLEDLLSGLTWKPGALAARDRLPAFCRRNAANFVAATVALRGSTRVTESDFEILNDAFGSRPHALPGHPFVAMYGGLNFYLANNPEAHGGFSRAPLERPPPLTGGMERYPRVLVAGLPPVQLTLTYPPHLEIVNHGYRLGWDWIRGHPRDYFVLAWRKLRIFWQGAALGFTGYNIPLGLSGTRRAVDVVVPVGGPRTDAWCLVVLFAVCVGLYAGRCREALVPWVLFAASQVLVTLLFFGYARLGATVHPVVALLMALPGTAWVPGGRPSTSLAPQVARRWVRASVFAAFLLVAVETARWLAGPVVLLDGREIGTVKEIPATDDRDRRLELR